MLELLGTLMGGEDRVKLFRLFLANPALNFTKNDILTRSRVTASSLNNEIKRMQSIGFVKPRSFWTGEKKDRKRVTGFGLNPTFPLLQSVKHLLFNTEPFTHEELIKKFKNTGRVKLIVLSGVFMKNDERRADLLIVGDHLRRKPIENIIKSMEAEIGQELIYSIFETEEFKYRLGMYDKLLRDILDYPHDVVVDKLGV